jgi:hypothetical protein
MTDLDTSDPRAVANELERLASASHVGSAMRQAMAAGARTIRKLIGDRPSPAAPPNPGPKDPKRAV